MTILTEQLHAGSFIVSERGGFYSRDQITLAAAAAIIAGTVLGKSGIPADETDVAAAAAGNTGNGTITMDASAPIGASAIDGVYQVDFRDATHYEVVDPNGIAVGEGIVGAAFNNQIKFNIAAGGTAFVEGDRFLITIGRQVNADELFAPLNESATDGTQIAVAVLIYPVGSDEAGAGVQVKRSVISRAAEVRASDLTWPAGITAAQQAEAIDQLAKQGIILR